MFTLYSIYYVYLRCFYNITHFIKSAVERYAVFQIVESTNTVSRM